MPLGNVPAVWQGLGQSRASLSWAHCFEKSLKQSVVIIYRGGEGPRGREEGAAPAVPRPHLRAEVLTVPLVYALGECAGGVAGARAEPRISRLPSLSSPPSLSFLGRVLPLVASIVAARCSTCCTI